MTRPLRDDPALLALLELHGVIGDDRRRLVLDRILVRAVEASARAVEKSYRDDGANLSAGGRNYDPVSWAAQVCRRRAAEDVRALSPASRQRAACPRCSDCEGQPHHWIPNDKDASVGAPDYACKHCDSGYAWSCIDCDEPLSEPDTRCGDCAGDDDADEDELQ